MSKNGYSPERRRGRWTPWKVFFLAFGLLVVLLVLLVTFAGVRFSVLARRRIDTQLAAVREAGEPTTPAELDEHYRLPPGVEDTTALWMEATALLDTPAFGKDAGNLPIVGLGDSEIPPPGEPWDDLEAVEELLQKYRASLEMMHEAAEAGGAARYPLDFDQGLAMLLDHVQRLRGGARMLSLEAHVRAHRGDPAGVARSIRTILTLARSLEREPVLVSMLVRIACEGIGIWQLEEFLGTVDFSEEDLVALQEDLRAADYEENLYQAMVGERVMMITAIQDPTGQGVDAPAAGLLRLTRRDGLALALETSAEFVAAARKPWPQALQAADQAELRLDQITRASTLNRIRYVLPALLLPATSAAFQAGARIRATADAADAAIAIERYRRKHGKLPERLDDLVPEFLPQVPTDPHDGQPLRYLVDEGGCRIYALGMNRTDEGGEGDLAGDPDVVFRVKAPREAGKAPEQ